MDRRLPLDPHPLVQEGRELQSTHRTRLRITLVSTNQNAEHGFGIGSKRRADYFDVFFEAVIFPGDIGVGRGLVEHLSEADEM